MSEEKSPEAPQKPSGGIGRKISYWGTIFGVVFVLFSITAAVVMQFLADDIDHALANLVTLGASVVVGVFVLVSFAALFWSATAKTPLVRWGALLVFVPLLLVPFFTIRFVGFTGDMMPIFRWSWQAPHDEQLADLNQDIEPATDDAGIDLTNVGANDYPQFLGPDRTNIISGVELSTDWTDKTSEAIWRTDIGAGWAGFAAVNGYAITLEQRGENEHVTCYEVETGKPVWTHSLPVRHTSVAGGIGPRSTPTIANSKVYALGGTGILRCLNGGTGELIWSLDLLKETGADPATDWQSVMWGRAASPLVVGEQVIIPAGGPVSGPFTSLISLDANTGEVQWKSGEEQVSYASPALATIAGVEQVLSVNQGTVTAHQLTDGVQLWSHPWSSSSSGEAAASQPVFISGDRVLLSKGYGQGAELLKITNDAGKWKVETVWKNRSVMRTKFTNVAIHDGHIYGLSDGILECVRIEDGKRMWKKGRYGHGQILLVGDHLLVQDEDNGMLMLIPATPEKPSAIAEFQSLNVLHDDGLAKAWNNLCFAAPYLIVRNDREAACFKLPLEEPAAKADAPE